MSEDSEAIAIHPPQVSFPIRTACITRSGVPTQNALSGQSLR